MTISNSPKIPVIIAVIFCPVFFYLFTFPITDGDCFWHLASGRWIAGHKALPAGDFLTFTATGLDLTLPENQWIPCILKQYWLGQLALFGAWQLGGSGGIVVLRALINTGILALLFFWMRRHNKGILPLILTLLAGLLLREIPNERPQLFSFAFTPLVLFLLERGADRNRQRLTALLCLPLLMLVWSNTHGAYILGIALIVLAVLPDLGLCLLRRQRMDLPFVSAAGCAVLVTLANPAGIMSWKFFFHSFKDSAATVYEYLSPIFVAIRLHDWHPAYWAYLIISLSGMLWYWRRMELKHLLTVAGLTLLSLTALRYLILPILAAPLLVRYLPEIPWRPRNIAAVITGFALWLGCTWDSNLLQFSPRSEFPRAAAEFIRQQHPAPQLFNHYDWGGYLSWFVPGVKTFMDGRNMIAEISLLQDRAMRGEAWRETVDRFEINTIVIPGMSETPGTVYPLAEMLAGANDWRLVFADAVALVFVRDIAANERIIGRHALDREALQRHLVQRAERLIAETPEREEYWLTKANALQLLGDRPGAVTAYRKVLQINPVNDWAKRMTATP